MDVNSSNKILDKIINLKRNAYWFWTEDIRDTKIDNDALNDLKQSQSSFIQILEKHSFKDLLSYIQSSQMPLSLYLFIKHLMRATDFSAELLYRTKEFLTFNNIEILHIIDKDNYIPYQLQSLGKYSNKRLLNEKILNANPDLVQDIVTIFIFGSQIKEFEKFISFQKFRLGTVLGNKDGLKNYFVSLYLEVHNQTKGSSSNSSGKLPQDIVKKYLDSYFLNNPSIKRISSGIPNMGDANKGKGFDAVYTIRKDSGNGIIYVAIEIAFQETTNSTLERKADLAFGYFREFKNLGYYLCYVIDGAGYFSREPALKRILNNSHLCVTFKPNELKKLCRFMENISTR